MLIWDFEASPPTADNTLLLWQGRHSGSQARSIHDYLEAHAERIRARYIEFVHDLGQTQINGRSVREHLALPDGFSFWWMSQIAEKNPFKSPSIFSCARLLALEELIRDEKPRTITLASKDKELAVALRELCKSYRMDFCWRHREKTGSAWTLRRVYLSLPYLLQGLISLRHLGLRWPLTRLKKPGWFAGDSALFICTYFFNLDQEKANKGEFLPRQLEGLPEHFRNLNRRTNWVHHYLRSPRMPGQVTALEWVKKFNGDPEKQGCHAFLESYLSPRVVYRVIIRWLWHIVQCWKLRSLRQSFHARDSAAWLWPFLRHDWLTSICGPVSVANCMWFELFDTVLKNLPPQKTGIFVWENQGWEAALVHAWRKHGHGRIIGVPHATVVFWHLNNFDSPRSLDNRLSCTKPFPDKLAVNGPMAWNAFCTSGFPAKRLVPVEALRFQYLGTYRHENSRRNVSSLHPTRKILVLGDFSFAQTISMLKCAEGATRIAREGVSVTLKSHPACPIKHEDFPNFHFEIVDLPLVELFPDFAFAFASNTSSAGLDAFLAGLPVTVFYDGTDFNHSPLRGIANVKFAGSAEELAASWMADNNDQALPVAGDYFWVDPQVPRWARLLANDNAGN